MNAPFAPALGTRDLFPRLGARAYLAHAAVAPVSLPVEQAVARALADYAEHGVLALPRRIDERKGLRSQLARLIGARGDDIALSPGTTHTLSQLAFSLPWKTGDRLVLFRGEFPANVTPWLQAAEHFGLTPLWLDLPPWNTLRQTDATAWILERLEAVLRRGVRLVAVSAVQFQTGLRMPVEAMGRLCRAHGAELAVDAIQAAGAIPIDVEREGIDYLACGSHKWLLGIEGAGFAFVRPELAPKLVPRLAGWLSHTEGERFLLEGPGLLRYDRPFKTSAGLLEGGSQNMAGLAALEASTALLLELGPEAIFHHVQRYLDALEKALEELGLRSLRSSEPACRSCILSVELPDDLDGALVVSRLRDAGVVVSYPDGVVRFAPHFANSLEEIPSVVDALHRALVD